MAKQQQVVVVPMTHWDREHSRPFEQFRWHLVCNVMEQLLGLLRAQPDYVFTMDGQALAIEDYLDLCPEREGEIRGYVEQGRLLVGPFFVGPDELIPSGESLIRNLLYGHQIAHRLGRVMTVASNPDAFGHIAQLPQILRGFGHDAIVFMRGGGNEIGGHGTEFRWLGPDGSEVLGIHHAYGNAAFLPPDPGAAAEKLRQVVDSIGPKQPPCFLLTNGTDGTAPQPHLREAIACANERYPELQFTCGTFEQYADLVRPHLASLPRYAGELHWGKYQLILGGVYSARTYLKQANAQTQMLLAALAEPLAAWAWLVEADPYPAGFLERAWRLLLENHFHDTICACSRDEVYHDAMMRYAHSQQISTKLIERSTKVIARNVNTDLGQPADTVTLVAYNPLARAGKDLLQAKLYLPFAGEAPQPSYVVRDADGRPVLSQVRHAVAREYFEPYVWERRLPYAPNLLELDLAIAAEVPASGYRTYLATPGQPAELPTDLQAGANSLENGLLRVEVAANGTMSLTDKRTGARFTGLHLFEDVDSACGEYHHYPSPHPQVITGAQAAARVSVTEAGPLCATLKVELELLLPEGLTPDRQGRSERLVACPVTSYVTLTAGSPRLDFHTIIENNVRDHRLRVLFPTGIHTDQVHVEAPFQVVARSLAPPEAQGWVEPPVPEHVQQAFVDVSDGKQGLALLNRGLPEYAALPGEGGVTLALTLLRGVGWIGRRGFVTAAYLIPTPEAQCLGRQELHYALLPHQGDWEAGGVAPAAHAFTTPLQAIETGRHGGPLPPQGSFLELQPDHLVVTAIKRAEADQALIVRLYNLSGREVAARLSCWQPIARAQVTNLLEEPLADVPVAGGAASFPVGAYQIVTTKLTFPS